MLVDSLFLSATEFTKFERIICAPFQRHLAIFMMKALGCTKKSPSFAKSAPELKSTVDVLDKLMLNSTENGYSLKSKEMYSKSIVSFIFPSLFLFRIHHFNYKQDFYASNFLYNISSYFLPYQAFPSSYLTF